MVAGRFIIQGATVRHARVFPLVLLLLGSSNRAQATVRLLFVPPLVVDDGASWQTAQPAVLRVQQALSRMPQFNVVARDGPSAADASRSALEQARELLQSGEKAYLQLDHAKAAGSFASAAELLTPLVESLDSADVRTLAKARFLEGTAWAESHHPERAVSAFMNLLETVPDEAMDDSMLPPKVRPMWQAAVTRRQAQNTFRLSVDADPPGADVSLDGRWRGRAPLTLTYLPSGTHRLTVSAPGYVTTTESVNLDATSLSRNITLKQAQDADGWRSLASAAAGPPDDAWTAALKRLSRRYNAEAMVMVGIKCASNGDTWMVLERWEGLARASIVVLTAPDKKLDLVPEAMRALFEHNASPVYMPRPKAPPLDFEGSVFGASTADNLELPVAEPSLTLWGVAGQNALVEFGPALGVGLGGTWALTDAWSFDLIAEATRATQANGSRADAIVGRLMLRRGVRWRRMSASAGIHGGVAGLFTDGAAGTAPSASELVPHAGLLARFDFDIGNWLLISLLGLGEVDALGLNQGKTLDALTFTITFHGLLGLGWRF